MRRVWRPPLGVSGRLVGSAAFKAVEGSLARLLVGSIPIHPRLDLRYPVPGEKETRCNADSESRSVC